MKQSIRLFILLALLSTQALAEVKSFTTPKSAVIVADARGTARVCYYQDQAYSLGAVIQVGDVYLVCQADQKFELNGALKWQPFKVDKQETGTKKDGQ